MNGTGDLIKKLSCSLHLPKGCLEKGSRTTKGARTKFNLENLRKHYKIGELFIGFTSSAKISGDATANISGNEEEDEEEDEEVETENEDEDEDECENLTTTEVLDDTNSTQIRLADGSIQRFKKR